MSEKCFHIWIDWSICMFFSSEGLVMAWVISLCVLDDGWKEIPLCSERVLPTFHLRWFFCV
jgi:hypothetical protein